MDRKRGQRIKRDPTERFSNRVENYIKYRPGYPTELFDFIYGEFGLKKTSTIADIGSGTGISAKPFLERGNTVVGVEPNDAMRNASIDLFIGNRRFSAIKGSAEDTGLRDSSIDLAFAAQSFHWFCNKRAVAEVHRILRKDGLFCVVWNERELALNEFHRDFEALIERYAIDYDQIRHDKFSVVDIENAFQREFVEVVFENAQNLDRKGLKGRLMSSSYIPDEASPVYRSMVENVYLLFDKHEESGRISVSYKTKLYFSKF